jgi:superoxide dismutase, Fe-Mn family
MTGFTLSRRLFLAGTASALTLPAMPRAFAQAAGPFSQLPLGYAFNALEPHIDAMTMEIHFGKHHAAYVGNLNNFAKDNAGIAAAPIETVLAKLADVPDSIRTGVRNNLGGHANHQMFWQIMAPGGAKAPEGDVKAAIDRDLGGFDKLQADFNAAGGRVFGSGWVFVTVDKEGKLALVSKPNQDTPLMDGQRVLFGNDVWEHAYYLKHQNRRADYLKGWWTVANWSVIGERYAAAKAGTLTV